MDPRRLAWIAAASLLLVLAAIAAPRVVDGGPDAPGWSDAGSDAIRAEDGPATSDVARPTAAHASTRSAWAAAERERIGKHLLGAEHILRAADASHLTEAQRERRARAIALLREYRRAGVFPHNHDFPEERVPYFRDQHGTLCAMAYLIAHTGGEDLVARVAETANNAYVAELAADPEFDAWLDRHGMTVAEAARVQPTYDCWTRPCDRTANEVEAEYALASAGSAALASAAVGLQLTDDGAPDAWRVGFGFATGGLGLALGAVGLDGTDGDAKLAALNFGVGAAALGTVAWRLIRGDDEPDDVMGGNAGPGLSWSARPALSADGAAGVRATLRF